MDEQVIQNVYILGKKSNIKRCFKAMTGRAPDIGDMVTDKEDVRLVTGAYFIIFLLYFSDSQIITIRKSNTQPIIQFKIKQYKMCPCIFTLCGILSKQLNNYMKHKSD